MNKKLTKLAAWSRIASRLALKPGKLNASLADFQFLSDRETIQYLKDTGKGIVRYGDGELNFTAGYPAIHQTQDRTLRTKLTRILKEYDGTQNYLLALPLDLLLIGNFAERNSTPENWRAPKYAALPFLKKNVIYGSPFCFRLNDVIDSDREEYTKFVHTLFARREIIFVGSREEDASGTISPVQFISIPERDAFSVYDETIERIQHAAQNLTNPLVLIAGGVTATVLAAKLNDRGIPTYDIGSLFT
ncbi:MAG: GT-D fold domain-containing glycosyltransferase [Candidatus Paceibacterota bacterium]